jgi:hypothetical protein
MLSQAMPDTGAYAGAAAQIVPVLLLAAVAVPLAGGRGTTSKGRAFVDVLLTAGLVGVAVLAEVVALFGVYQGGLSQNDRSFLTAMLIVTALLAGSRIFLPIARTYSEVGGVPEGRAWAIFSVPALLVFVGVLYLLA